MGCMIPFGDGPHPIYNRRVGKSVIMNMASQANRSMYIMTPYLIIHNELAAALKTRLCGAWMCGSLCRISTIKSWYSR